MPWVKAGEVTPAEGQTGSINVSSVSANTIGYRFNNQSGVAPRQFGYLTAWTLSPFPDATTIETARLSIPCWHPAGQYLIIPTGGFVSLRRIGFHRLFKATTPQPISLYYFTP
jgi:hypothetical protein